jgi:hypothetical protein
MTIQQVIAHEQEINLNEVSTNTMQSFEKFYGENVTITQSDKTSVTGKEENRKVEIVFNQNITEIRTKKLVSSIVLPSNLSDYEFMVIATWDYDLSTKYYPIKGLQTSFTYWANDMIQKVEFYTGTEVIE